MSNLQIRSITGLVFGIVVLGAVYFSPLTSYLLFGLIAFFCLKEYYALELIGANKTFTAIAMVAAITPLVVWIFTDLTSFSVFFYLPFVSILFFVLDLFLNKENAYSGKAIGGIMLITLPFILLIDSTIQTPVSLFNPHFSDWNKYLLITLILLTWANDVGAYFIGKFFGKRKLFERISPNKTWAGFFGGVAFSVIVVFLLFNNFEFVFTDNHFNLTSTLILGVVLSVFASLGDLFQSYIKRLNGVKDSGKLLPGHGGMWDRFDGFLFVIYGYLFMQYIVNIA